MNQLVPIALFGWILVILAVFTMFKPRRAVLVSFIGGWLFLPHAGIGLPGLPDYTKVTAASLAVVLGVLLFDAGRIQRYRPSWVDLPILSWCLAPLFAALTNGLGVYDGLSGMVDQIMTWGIPWLVGRLYFNTPEAIRELAVAVFIGGLIYLPLCLWEIRMSPNLHRLVYGFHPTHFMMTKRFGGYRPMVFMQHGLMLGLWMACTSLLGVWLWRSGAVRKLFGVPMGPLVAAMLGVTVLCKSTGALALLMGGLVLLFMTRTLGRPWLVLCAVMIAPGYMFVRANGSWGGEQMIELAGHIDEKRAASLEGRLENEDLIVARAMEQPLFGWGRWGRWRVRDEHGKDITVSDGLWVITLGQSGLVGLVSLTAVLLLPIVLLIRRLGASGWSHPLIAPAAGLAVVLILYMLDCLLNAMLNPIYLLGAGALSGLYALGRRPLQEALWQEYHRQAPVPAFAVTREPLGARMGPYAVGTRPSSALRHARTTPTPLNRSTPSS